MCKKKPTKCIVFAHMSFFVQRFNISNSFFCLLMSNFIIDEGQCSCKRAVLSFGSVCHPDFLLFVSLFLDVDAVSEVMHDSSLQVVVHGVSRGNCGGGYAVGCVGGDGHIVESNDFLRAVGCVDSLKTDGGGCFPVAFESQFHLLPFTFVVERGTAHGAPVLRFHTHFGITSEAAFPETGLQDVPALGEPELLGE